MNRGGRTARTTVVRIAATCFAAALVLTGCAGEEVTGQLQTEGDVAGLPVTHFESGLKEHAPEPDVRAKGATDSDEDRLALSSIADITDYWNEEMPRDFGQKFRPVSALMSYDPKGPPQEVCGENTRKLAQNAFYCPPDDMVAWDRTVLLPLLKEKFGSMAVAAVLGHEFGHAVQTRLGRKAGISQGTSTIVKEQQADCFMGSYMRWIAEDNSEYFDLSTSDGLGEVLGALFMIRDAPGAHANEQGAHGSGFDRTYAVQLGFEDGAARCADIDQDEVDERITEVPFKNAADMSTRGEADINATTMQYVQRSLDDAFSRTGAEPPELVEGDGTCDGDDVSTPPVSYCASDNRVDMDMTRLTEIGQPADQQAELSGQESPDAGLGDFAAFSEVASRYVQGIQQQVGAPTTGAQAGLRTSCLIGAWAKYVNNPQGKGLYLSPGDLDEAIAELQQPRSLLAADIEGHRVANGFARIEALRNGYLEGSQTCTDTYK